MYQRQAHTGAARKATREANTKEEVMALVQPFINHADQAIERHYSTLDTLPQVLAAGSVAAANTLAAQQDRPFDERRAAEQRSGRRVAGRSCSTSSSAPTTPCANRVRATHLPAGPRVSCWPIARLSLGWRIQDSASSLEDQTISQIWWLWLA